MSYRLASVGSGANELQPQEACYWLYAQHPALCCDDHPPMNAFLFALAPLFAGMGQIMTPDVPLMLFRVA